MPRRAGPNKRKVLGSGVTDPTWAEKVTSGDASSSTKVPPLVITGESVHSKISPAPVIGPIEVNMAQEENSEFVGPSIRSEPLMPARENPTNSRLLVTKNRVPVVSRKVPTPPIVTEAELSSIENPPVND